MRLLAALVLAPLLFAAEPSQERIAALAEEARRAWEVPGVALAVVQKDQILYQSAHGVKELGKPEALSIHSTFQIASTTKAFTSAALAMLVDEGRLSWDDPVRQHLPSFRLADPHADALVTLRDLLSHRTGLPRHDVLWIRTGSDREDLIRRMAFAKPTASFRSQYQYQNIMFTTAGEVVGRASGLGWDRFIEQRIFAPLGMRDSSTIYSRMIERSDRAMPHSKNGAQITPGVWGNYDNIGGAGCIASSVADMTEWLRLQLNHGEYQGRRLVSSKSLQETHAPNMFNRLTDAVRDLQPDFTQSSYGLGWSINHYRGEMLIMHAGVLSGFRALVTMVPRLQLGFVILANLNGTNLNEALTNTLLDAYLGLPPHRDWNAHMLAATKRARDKEAQEKLALHAARQKNTQPSLALDAYAGTYSEPAYGEAKISLEDSKLFVEWARFRAPLDHWHFDTFTSNGKGSLSSELLTFSLDEKGKVVKLKLFGQEFARKN